MLLIFDLDGTIFQAKPVVLRADWGLLRELGAPWIDESALFRNAGRGVDTLLRNILPADVDLAAARARYIEIVREAILDIGELFPGVREALELLYAQGHALVVCSNSPEEYVKLVLEHTGISGLFARYLSSEAYTSKAEAIRELLGETAVVIGDTHGDVEAAHENGLPAIAAAYGYGNREMLAAADYLAETPEDIANCVATLCGLQPTLSAACSS